MPDQILDSTINPTANSEHADRSDISAPSVTLSETGLRNSNAGPESCGADDDCGEILRELSCDDDELDPANSGDPGITFDSIKAGEQYDVLDSMDKWCEAEVVKKDIYKASVYITYIYWDHKFDEWISDIGTRFAPLHAHTYTEGGVLKCQQRIEALDERNVWLEAFVCEETPNKVKIHYKGYHPKFDTWMDRDSPNIRPYGRSKHALTKRKDPKQWKVPGKINQQHDLNMQQSNRISQNNYFSDDKENVYKANSKLGLAYPEYKDAAAAAPSSSIDMEERTRKISELSDHFFRYKAALERHNLHVVSVSGDGNCLFRSVAHQIYGDDSLHMLVREKCVEYMESEADFFCQFVEGGRESFPYYLQAKRCDACWGDDPEIEAICELYNRPAEIWAFDPTQGAQKLRTFHESGNMGRNSASSPSRGGASMPVMRLSYYGGGHYDSIVSPWHADQITRRKPGELEDFTIARSKERSRSRTATAAALGGRISALSDVHRISDQEATDQATLELALQESRRLYANRDYDDLETSLLLSISSSLSSSSSSVMATAAPSDRESKMQDPTDTDILAVQGELLRSVTEQSEREYIDKAIVSSLVEGGRNLTEEEVLDKAILSSFAADDRASNLHSVVSDAELTEDELLQQAQLASAREFEANQEKQIQALTSTDNSLSRALELSLLSEQEALEIALKESMTPVRSHSSQHGKASSSSGVSFAAGSKDFNGGTVLTRNNREAVGGQLSAEEEDLMLQRALAMSMKSNEYWSEKRHGDEDYSASSSSSFNRSSNSSHNINSSSGTAAANSNAVATSSSLLSSSSSSAPLSSSLVAAGNDAASMGYGLYGGDYDFSEDMDEDLLRAIEASLRK